MDDLKLYAKSEEQKHMLVRTVYVFSRHGVWDKEMQDSYNEEG